MTAPSSEHDDGEAGSVVGTGSPLKSSVKGAGSDKPLGPVTFDQCKLSVIGIRFPKLICRVFIADQHSSGRQGGLFPRNSIFAQSL